MLAIIAAMVTVMDFL